MLKNKHAIFIDHSELDSMKEFDPNNDRVDQLIFARVLGENQKDTLEMLGQGPITSLNGDGGGY